MLHLICPLHAHAAVVMGQRMGERGGDALFLMLRQPVRGLAIRPESPPAHEGVPRRRRVLGA